ncbi:MAG: glycosyltransferase [Acidimicrobiales bacterium]
MIFVTVGAQMPFDRLISTVDAWAVRAARDDVVAQIGDSQLRPRALVTHERLPSAEFERLCAEAELIIAHAGMGSILTALRSGTPILVMPRRYALRETRNDHQVATATRLATQGRVAVALDEQELEAWLDDLDELTPPPSIGPHASPELIGYVRGFVADRPPRWRNVLARRAPTRN